MQSITVPRIPIVTDSYRPQTVTEIVKLPVSPENQLRLLSYVQQWHEQVFPYLPGFQRAAILKNTADAILVYGHWDSQDAIERASKDTRLAPYFQGLMPLLAGRPEIHICSVEMVVTAPRQTSNQRSLNSRNVNA